ncbi:hypothetical protein BC567DRAFT_228389, partial [Phyllosticta citribraziliensis]
MPMSQSVRPVFCCPCPNLSIPFLLSMFLLLFQCPTLNLFTPFCLSMSMPLFFAPKPQSVRASRSVHPSFLPLSVFLFFPPKLHFRHDSVAH